MSHTNWDPMNNIARRRLFHAALAATTATASAEVDTKGAEDVVFTIDLKTINSTGNVTFQVQDSDVSGSGYANVTGAASAAIVAAGDERLVRIRCRKSQLKRYAIVLQTTAGAGTGVDMCSVVAELHGLKSADLADGSPDSPISGQSTTKFDAAV